MIFTFKKCIIYTISILVLGVILLSCQKEATNQLIPKITSNEEAFAEFSKILSKAVFNEPTLREFLKQESLKRYDNDYDVFCPWAFDKQVKDNSFRNILKRYDEENRLEAILNVVPKLTILVPDWSWVNSNCFSVHNWNTERNEVAVGFQTKNHQCQTYFNGEILDILEPGTFVSAPLLIIKENERMVVKPSTKGDTLSFDFVSEEFNNYNNDTKGGTYHFDEDFPYVAPTNYISNDLLSGRLTDVYNKTKDVLGLPQRDYVYYSLLSPKDSGSVSIGYHEVIHKIKLNILGDWAQNNFSKEVPFPDFNFKDEWLVGNHNLHRRETLQNFTWADGDIELLFYIYNGNKVIRLLKSLSINDAFKLTRVLNVRKYNWIGALQYSHYYVDPTCFKPKWIEVNFSLFIWDLLRIPNEYKIEVYEMDGEVNGEKKFSEEYTYSQNFKVNGGVEGSPSKGTIKVGAEGGNSKSIKVTKNYSYQYCTKDNFLGETYVDYRDNFIVSQDENKSKIHVYTCGDVDIMLLPMYN